MKFRSRIYSFVVLVFLLIANNAYAVPIVITMFKGGGYSGRDAPESFEGLNQLNRTT